MAVSLSQSMIDKKKEEIADTLTGQTQDLQETPWWKTAGGILLPLLSTAAMGPLGGYLASLGGATGGLSSLITGFKGASILSKLIGLGGKGIGAIGKGLQAAKKGQGILSALGGIGAKTAFNIGARELSEGILGKFDKRSVKDLKLNARDMLYGGDALQKLRKQYTSAKGAEKDTSYTGALLSALSSQLGPNILKGLTDAVGGAEIPVWSKHLKGTQDLVKGGKSFGDINILDKVAQISKDLQSSSANMPLGQSIPNLVASPGIGTMGIPYTLPAKGGSILSKLASPGPKFGAQPAPDIQSMLQGADDQTILDIILALQNK